MKLTRWLSMLLLSALVGPVQSLPDKDHIYLVVGQVGKCTTVGAPDKPISLLSYLAVNDTVACPKNSSLTVTNVLDGSRYQISGKTSLTKVLVPNQTTIKSLNKTPEQRKGIQVSHQVDMSKYGGYTSRSLVVRADAPIPISVEKLPVTLDLTLGQRKWEGPASTVRYRKVNDHGFPSYTRADASPDGTQLTLPNLELEPNQTTMIFFEQLDKDQDKDPGDNRAAFAVTLLDPQLAQSLKTVRGGDQASELEAFENYCNLEVYWPARQLRDKLLKQHPEARQQIENLFKKWIEPSRP